jgi:magnesium-transporting ATPase (P-type)
MQRPPRGAHSELLPTSRLISLAFIGLVLGASTLGMMAWVQGTHGEAVARTMGWVTFALAGIFLALEANDELGSMFSTATFASGKLLQMSLFAVIATIVVTELGLFQRIFATTELAVDQWVACIVVASAIVWIMELQKLVRRRRGAPHQPQTTQIGEAVA